MSEAYDYVVTGKFWLVVKADSQDEARKAATYIMDNDEGSITVESATIKLNPMSEAARWGRPV